jgi:phage FluMu protein Com
MRARNFFRYRCVHCGQVLLRESRKRWIKSYCDRTGRYVRLQRVV